MSLPSLMLYVMMKVMKQLSELTKDDFRICPVCKQIAYYGTEKGKLKCSTCNLPE